MHKILAHIYISMYLFFLLNYDIRKGDLQINLVKCRML